MIQIKCGTCGTSQGYKTAADGKLTLPRDEEARLVSRGVAEYVTRPILNAGPDAEAPAPDAEETGQGVTLPKGGNTVPGAETAGTDTPTNKAGEGLALNDCLVIEDGHITKESLLLLSRHDMEALAADLKVDVSRCKNKGEIAELLSAVELTPGEPTGEDVPPELGAEGPVV